MGGYTAPAIADAKWHGEQLIKMEKDETERIEKEYQASIASLAEYKDKSKEKSRLRKPLYENAVYLYNRMNILKDIYIKKQRDDIAREKAIRAEVERLSILKEAHQRMEAWERQKEAKKIAVANANYLSAYQKEFKYMDSLMIL